MSDYKFPDKEERDRDLEIMRIVQTMPDEVFDRCLSTIDKLNKEREMI